MYSNGYSSSSAHCHVCGSAYVWYLYCSSMPLECCAGAMCAAMFTLYCIDLITSMKVILKRITYTAGFFTVV